MNHIYKTIFNKRTGDIFVVSEKSSNQSRSQNNTFSKNGLRIENKASILTNIINKSTLTIAISFILGSSTAFAIVEYNGNLADLSNSQNIGGNFNQLINSSTANGITEFNSTSAVPLASSAEVTINYSSGENPDFVVAGYNYLNSNSTLETSTTSNNIINLEQGNITGNIYSGLSQILDRFTDTTLDFNVDIFSKKLESNNNYINIGLEKENNIKVLGNIYSGYSSINIDNLNNNGDAYNKSMFINVMDSKNYANNNYIYVNGNKSLLQNITAGYSSNIIDIKDLIFNDESSIDILYRFDNYSEANNNSIYIKGDSNNIANIVSGDSSIKNIINISDPLTNNNILGNTNNAESSVFSNFNIVYISGNNNSIGNVIAGKSILENTKNTSSNSSSNFYGKLNSDNNSITLNGFNNVIENITSGNSSIISNLYGYENLSTSQMSSTNNSINLLGESEIKGSIYTGYINLQLDNINQNIPDIDLSETQAVSIENTISITGKHKFTNPNSVIYGGYLAYNQEFGYKPESYDVFTGNTLNYNNNMPIKIKEVGNFQTYNFTLNPNLANTSTAMIEANQIKLGANIDNISDDSTTASDIYVSGIQAGKILKRGDQIIMMKAVDSLSGEGVAHNANGVSQPSTTPVQQGISLRYDIKTEINQVNKQVTATILNNASVNPQLKALLEGNLSGLMLLTRGGDHLSDNLFSSDDQNKRGLFPFAVFSGNHSRYDSGSHIKSNGGLFTTGFSVYDDQSVWGAFIENGWDSYKTHNSFDNAVDINGKGHNRFNGFGTFARYTFANDSYLDGTWRFGRLQTSFETDDLRNTVTSERVQYDVKGNYYGFNLKGGYNWAWNNNNSVDISAKYSYAGTESHNLNVAGDDLHFDALNSHRILLNAENNYQINPEITLLSGLGYEQELAGKAKGTTYGVYEIDDASVKGSTGIATLGVRYQPKQYQRLNIDLKGTSYFGKREGGSALLKVDYKF